MAKSRLVAHFSSCFTINKLKNAGFLESEVEYKKNSKEIAKRKLKVLDKCFPKDNPVGSGRTLPLAEKAKDIINKYNKIYNNSSSRRFSKNEAVKAAEKPMVDRKTGTLGKKFEPDSKPYKLAEFFEECFRFNEPKFPQSEQQRQRWAKDIDLMLRLDKVEADDIAAVIEWSQQDDFWRSNILSGKKLREKYPQLLMKMNQKWR